MMTTHRRTQGAFLALGTAVFALSIAASQSPSFAQESESEACAMLEDPELRPLMSSALEIKLGILCQLESGEAATLDSLDLDAIPPAAGPAKPESLTNGFLFKKPDRLVNDPAQDVVNFTQSETSLSKAGFSNLCAAWNDAGQLSNLLAFGLSGFGYSANGGKSWVDGGFFPPGPPPPNSGFPDTNFGDPSLAYSIRDHAFYYAALSTAGLSLWKSTDLCRSFSYVGPITLDMSDDKELIAIDNNIFSPFFGRIHVGWTRFSAFPDRNLTSYSDNGGGNWSFPATLVGSGPAAIGMWPSVAPDGTVYFALERRCFGVGCLHDQLMYRSVNGGATWNQAADIDTATRRPQDAAATASCGRAALNGDIRNLSSPQIAIHKDANAPAGYVIHTTFPRDPDGFGPDVSDVYYRRSVDGGASWSAAVRLNDDATDTDQWYPAIGVNFLGVVVVSWYDRRRDPVNNLRFDRFAVVSKDGGLNWGPNKRVSDVSSPVSQNNPHFDGLARCYHGDYDQLVVGLFHGHILWSDDRRIVAPHGPDPDIRFDNLFLFGGFSVAGAK